MNLDNSKLQVNIYIVCMWLLFIISNIQLFPFLLILLLVSHFISWIYYFSQSNQFQCFYLQYGAKYHIPRVLGVGWWVSPCNNFIRFP